MTETDDWTTPRILKAAVDFRCTGLGERHGFPMRCNELATDVVDNADGTSQAVCPQHGGRP